MAGNCEFLTRNPINIFSWNLPCNVVYLPWIETFQFRGKSFHTAQKMRFSIKDFFSKCEEIRRKLRIWSHLLKKSLIENLIFCAVYRVLPFRIILKMFAGNMLKTVIFIKAIFSDLQVVDILNILQKGNHALSSKTHRFEKKFVCLSLV